MKDQSETIEQKFARAVELITEEEGKEMVRRAYALAANAHGEQKRESGDPYIIHPVEAALTLAEMHMDAQTIAAALLHDVVDDTSVTLEDIEKQFGKDVSFLVDGVSKLGRLKYRGEERHAENLRKMLVAMAQDVRVILIKFADRLHNMKTLDALPPAKQRRIALETLEIYSPIAMRLGVSELAKQLEDLAFPYVYPDQYKYIKAEAMYRFPEAEQYLKKLHPVVLKELQNENIKPLEIQMRTKHYYSLWRKLERYHYNWPQIHDLIAMRIIVGSVEECYATLGALHKLWKPLPGQIKDYIALPKPSGYQSIHTTVFCIDGRQTEFQIRTSAMHENAEYGVAAHWRYKNKGELSGRSLAKTFSWVGRLQEWKKDAAQTDELINNLKIDVFRDRIFVFTPRGAVIDLPQGAVPLDFAYAIHSEIGDTCSGAIIDGKMVSLDTELTNGAVVEIICSKKKTPSRTWLNYVKTNNARNSIRHWFKQQNREENKEIGLNLLNTELKAVEGVAWTQLPKERQQKILKRFSCINEDDLLIALGLGDLTTGRVMQGILATAEQTAKNDLEEQGPIPQQKAAGEKDGKSARGLVHIAGIGGIQAKIAQCCNPISPETIASYVTRDRGAIVHRINCKNLHHGTERILPAYWTEAQTGRMIKLEMEVADRIGMLQDISKIIAGMNINITSFHTKEVPEQKNEQVTISMDVEVRDLYQLKGMIEKLNSVEGIYSVRRA